VTHHPDNPWLDRFRTPTADALIEAVPEERATVLAELRAALTGAHGREETVEWRGEPCRWCLCYTCRGQKADDCPPWVIVPNPKKPVFLTGLRQASLAALSEKKLGRGVRECLTAGRVVGPRVWVEWPCEPGSASRELLDHLEVIVEGSRRG